MSADIHRLELESVFDPDAVDSSRTVEIVGIPVESGSAVSGSAVSVSVASAFVEAAPAVCFDAEYAGLQPRPTAQA